MSSLSIIDKPHNHSHLRHFVVQTRTFQIEKARNVNMYANLRVYIKRQNEKRKQEMEMSEELKRARREKELKHKRDKSTLGDIKEEIIKNSTKLSDLQNEKHKLFLEFKRVLNADSTRKNQIQQKEDAAAYNHNNITFGPVTTSSSASQKQFQGHISSASSASIMPNNAHSSILPNSLTHLHPIQSIFFPQPHSTAGPVSSASPNVSTSSSISSSAAIIHHRLNGRAPTSTTFAGSSKSNPSSTPVLSKTLPQHPPMSIPSSVSSPSPMVPTSALSPFQNDRHRMSYKRTHEQASSSPINMQNSGGVITVPGPVTSAPPHLHYIPNYKPAMGQPSMPPMPPGAFSQIGAGQHIIPNIEQLNHPLYQSFLNSYGNPMSYMNNSNPNK